MPEIKYNINSLYISIFVLAYNIFYTNYNNIIDNGKNFINFLGYNYMTIFVIINIIGLYLLLIKIKIEINIKWNIKYN
jgi:hypothetical protein